MIPSIAILIIGSIIAYVEVPPLLEKGLKREVWSFSLLLLFGVTIYIIKAFDVMIPSPLKIIETIYHPIYTIISSLLE